MNEVLAISLRAMQAAMGRVEQAGVNLTNVLTPAYKRGVAIQQAPFTQALDAAARHGVTDAAPAFRVQVDTRAATLKATAQPWDLAIAGPGWFEVMTDSGPAYTRQGEFRLDGRGRLVTPAGYPVMGTGGEIVMPAKRPVVSASGEISDADAQPGTPPLARLRIVDVENGTQLQPIGGGLYTAPSGLKQIEASALHIRQGFLENSNVDPAREMTELALSMRHFESMQKVVQGLDDMVGTAIRKLGETS